MITMFIRITLILGFVLGAALAAPAAEVVTDARVLELDEASLQEFRAATSGSFVVNLSPAAARSILDETHSRTLQSFQLSAADARPVQFRVASRVGSMDVGIDFEFTGQVSLKREIHITVTSQTHVIYGENESLVHPVFAGEPVRQEIITAEGSHILVAGLIASRDARQLANMEKLRESPILNSIVNEKGRPVQLVLLLTPRIVGTPEAQDVVSNSGPPQMQNQFTVQIGAFESGAHARTLLAGLTQRYKDAFIQETNVAGKPFYRVRVGRFADSRQASLLEKQLRSEGMAGFVAQID